jgi:diguanylate cyclase (GGDEF)-like protein
MSITTDSEDYHGTTILIIDDNATNLGVAVTYLEDSGFNVLVAQNGESGLRRSRYAHPQLILLDVMMPDMDGFTVCRHLKADASTANIPIIFMSAMTDMADKLKGFEVGAVDYVTKPIQREELLARVVTHVKIQLLTQQLRQQNQFLQQQAQELKQAQAQAAQAYAELELLANLDGLTQIANRRCFDLHLEQEWQRLAREQAPLALILADIDFFKPYNDYYGHQLGDVCLRQIAQTLQSLAQRPADLVARYGGEEIAIILPNTSVAGAAHMAGQICEAVNALAIPHAYSTVSDYVTISIGVSSLIPQLHLAVESLITEADRALYRAKNQGRNRYCLSPAIASEMTASPVLN